MGVVSLKGLVYRHQVHYRHLPDTQVQSDDGILAAHVDESNVGDVLGIRDERVVNRFRSMLYDGQRGIFAYSGGSLAGHAWIVRADQDSIVNGYYELAASCGLIHFCYVSPEFRGKRIFSHMVRELVQRNRSTLRDIFIDHSVANRASQQAIERMEFQRLGEFRTFGVGSKLLWSSQN